MSTATSIIRRCGGFQQVADWLGVSRTTVLRWTLSRDQRGTGGVIPSKHWPPLIAAAKLNGIEISLDELIPAAAHEAARLPTRKRKAA